MTQEQALEAFNAARDAANDAWQVWCGNAHTGATAAKLNELGARWRELNRVELEARATLDRIAQIEKTHGHGG